MRGLAKASFSWGPIFCAPPHTGISSDPAQGRPPAPARPQFPHCSPPCCRELSPGPAAIPGVPGLPLSPSGEFLGLPLGQAVVAPAPHGCPSCSTPWQHPLLQHPMAASPPAAPHGCALNLAAPPLPTYSTCCGVGEV